MERLHQTNRARHELELRLKAEQEANLALNGTLKQKLHVIEAREH